MSTTLGDTTLSQVHSDGLYEIVNGQTVELEPMGAYEELLALALYDSLSAFVNANALGRAVHELLFEMKPLDRSRRPDVGFVSYERWARDRRLPRTPAWEVIPDLAVEVVSPSNTMNEIVGKVNEYFTVGVRAIWVVLPEDQQVYIYESPDRIRVLNRNDVLTGEPVLNDFSLPLADFFESTPDET